MTQARWQGALRDILSVLVYGCILLVKTYCVKYSLVGNYPLHRSFLLGTLGAVIVITALLLLLRPRARYYAFLGINLLITIILVADVVYGRYFRDVTSVALLKQARLAGEVQESVFALIEPRDLAYFIDLLVLVPLLCFQRDKRQPQSGLKWPLRLVLTVICLLVGANLTQASIDSLQQRQPGLIRAFWDKQVVAHNIGTLNFHAIDAWRYLKKQMTSTKLSQEEQAAVAQWFAEHNAEGNKQYHNLMQGKNLIMVQLEAFQGFVLNFKINGQEVTPNLNRLAKKSLTFNNIYAQTAGGGTSDAEFLANVSLYPAREGAAFYEFYTNTFQSLPMAAKEQGYETVVMHANRPGFWNRTHMYTALGFDTYYSDLDFDIDEVFGLGLTDHSFYRQAVQKMQQMQQPFYAFLVSLSSHFPFVDANVSLSDRLDVGAWQGTFIGNYLQNIHFADEAVGVLIDELQAAGLWDNSVVVIYGDHTAIPHGRSQELAKLLYGKEGLDELQWQEEQKVVMMLHLPGDRLRGVNDRTAGQIDIFPTLANLLGFKSKYAAGRDLLNTDNGFVCFRNGTWINDDVIYFRSQRKLLDLKTGTELAAEDFAAEIERAEIELKVSDQLLEYDLIRQWQTEADG